MCCVFVIFCVLMRKQYSPVSPWVSWSCFQRAGRAHVLITLQCHVLLRLYSLLTYAYVSMLLPLMCFRHLHSRVEESWQYTSACCSNAGDLLCRNGMPVHDSWPGDEEGGFSLTASATCSCSSASKPSCEENHGKGFGTERHTVHKHWRANELTRHVCCLYQYFWILR